MVFAAMKLKDAYSLGQCGGEGSGGKGPGLRWRDAASTRTRSSGMYILGGSYKTEGLKQVEEKWK